MADKEVTSKLILQGDSSGMVSAMEAAKAKFSGIAGGMQSAVGGISNSFVSMGGIVGSVMGVLAGGAMSAAIAKTKEVAGEVVLLSKAFGISAEEASVLRVALDDSLVSIDTAVAASDRLTRTSLKNSEVFKRLGIDIKDSDGHLKDSMSLMLEVNDYLLKLKEGKDRDSVAMTLYGKSWRELSSILKFNSGTMEESRERAEKLHLIFGDDRIAQVKAYKLAMKDIEDVSESLKVQLGTALMPVLTELSVAFGDVGVEAANFFAKSLSSGLATAKELGINLKLIGELASIKMSGGVFYDPPEKKKELAERRAAAIAEYKSAMAEMNSPTSHTPAKPEKPGKYAPEGLEGKKTDWTAAEAKWVEYYKSFEERKAAQIKISNDYDLELNQQAYDKGLIDYRAYLAKRNDLTLSTLDAAVEAKKNELIAAQNALKTLKPATDSKGRSQPDKDSANRADALKKEEEAQKAYLEAVGKVRAAKAGYAFDSEMADYKEAERINGLIVQLMEVQGHYEDAARARAAWEQQSVGYTNLSPAEKALKDAAMANSTREGASRDRDLVNQRSAFMSSLNAAAGGNNKFGNPYLQSQRDAIEQQYQQRLKAAEDFYGKDAALAEQWGQAKEKAAAERDRNIATFEKETWDARIGTVGDQMGRLGSVLMQGNKEQFEAGKALAIASTIVNTYMAASSAFSGITASTGGWGIALAATEAALAVTIGLAQVAQIESTKYTPREKGGPVLPGQTYLVGEKRPELLTMGRDPGYITPYVPKNSGNTVVKPTIVLQISPGVQGTVQAEIMRSVPALTNHMMAAMAKSINGGTELSAAVGRM